MKREILCLKCGSPAQQLPTPAEDVLAGFHERWTHGKLVHSATCDHCGAPMNPSDDAVAHCMWKGSDPGNWELDYLYGP